MAPGAACVAAATAWKRATVLVDLAAAVLGALGCGAAFSVADQEVFMRLLAAPRLPGVHGGRLLQLALEAVVRQPAQLIPLDAAEVCCAYGGGQLFS